MEILERKEMRSHISVSHFSKGPICEDLENNYFIKSIFVQPEYFFVHLF